MQGAAWRQMLCAMWQIFRGCVSLSITGTSRRGEHLAGHEIMRQEKGRMREKKKKKKNVNSCLFFLDNLWTTVYVNVCACLRGV